MTGKAISRVEIEEPDGREGTESSLALEVKERGLQSVGAAA